MPKPGLRRGAGAGPAQLVRGARQIDNFLKEKIIVGGAGGASATPVQHHCHEKTRKQG